MIGLPIEFDGVDPATIAALEELARQEWEFEALKAQVAQDRFARAFPEMNAVDGLGAVRRNVDAFAFHDWAIKLGSYDCWRDKSFNRYMDRLAPETRVKARGTKPGNGLALQVGWTPPNTPRFRKSYGEAVAA